MTGYLTFPYQIDASGRTATSDLEDYVATLIRLVLQTDPGERVNRPDFGGGLKSLVFMGMDNALRSSAETLIRSKLLQSLGDVISIQSIQVTFQQEELLVDLTYVIVYTGQQTSQIVTQGLPGANVSAAPSTATGRATARLAQP